MGNEANCTVKFGKQRLSGKALLESSELIFRSDDGPLRLKIAFSSITSAKVINGELRLKGPHGLATFELGASAAKWCEKILHPKTRLEKLGVKPNAIVSSTGNFDAEFLAELNACTRNITTGTVASASDLIFFTLESSRDLTQLAKLTKNMKGASALWIVYPKGQEEITEKDVLIAGRKTGLKDVKVVGFSSTHTALKFVIPVDRRWLGGRRPR